MSTWMRGSSGIPSILDAACYIMRTGQTSENGGSRVQMYRNGRNATDGKVWKIRDRGCADADHPEKTDLGWEFVNEGTGFDHIE